MRFDKILLIPYLSNELNLIGFKALPYKLKSNRKRSKKKIETKLEKESCSIVFDSKKMICELVSVCIDLVKDMKASGFRSEADEVDKLNFENIKLEKQVNLLKKDIEKKINELAVKTRLNCQLEEKVDKLEKKIKDYETKIKKVTQNCKINDNTLKHTVRKQKSDIKELHNIIWKQFNMVDHNYFPENFELIQIHQPDFNKLWSEVKYSSLDTKESALKKAVCIFQENNNLLMQDNHLLKSLLLITLQEVKEGIEFLYEKLFLVKKFPVKIQVNELLQNVEKLNVDTYQKIVQEHFDIIRNAFELFEEASFSISGELFVCWSDIVKKSESLLAKI